MSMPARRPPLLNHEHVLFGVFDEEVQGWLVRAFEISSETRLPLHRCLLLPAGQRLAVARRDFWLLVAGGALGGSAAKLQRAAEEFDRRTWRTWRHLSFPPTSAGPVQGPLHLARRSAPFPKTRQQFARILREHGTEMVDDAFQKLAKEEGVGARYRHQIMEVVK